MTDYEANTRRRRRVAPIVAGALAGLLALAALAVGAAALLADDEKNERGYLMTDGERFATGERALATDNLDIDLSGASWVVDTDDLGRVELEVAPEGDKPVFAGIARTEDVASYLRGVGHTRVTDVDAFPFEASYLPAPGSRRPKPPARESFWDVSSAGRGTQTLDWRVREGDWSVVVMNADGSRGVATDVRAGAKLPFLDELGVSALGAGGLLLIVAIALTVLGARGAREPLPAT